MEMEVEEEGEVEKGSDGTPRKLGSLEFFTQEVELSVTMLVDAHNGFNELSKLEMIWTMCHC